MYPQIGSFESKRWHSKAFIYPFRDVHDGWAKIRYLSGSSGCWQFGSFGLCCHCPFLTFNLLLFSRTTPTLTPPSHAWWRTSCRWRRRVPWVMPPPKEKQKAVFWFCLASTTARRRKDLMDVQDAPRSNPKTETATVTEGGDKDGSKQTKGMTYS